LDAEADFSFAEMVRHTLKRMAMGGIYDQIGGGFHRYSVDERWMIPHFEKMLYDNALLARLYLDGGRALKEPAFLTVAADVLDYVIREMTDSGGGFYASTDADSEGHEGRFFVWTPTEVKAAVGEELAALAMRYYGITEEGNFEGSNIPFRTLEPSEAARLFGLSESEAVARIAEIRERMYRAREHRPHPARDEKILTAWNAMMISAMAEGFIALGNPRYLDAARRAAIFIMTRLWDGHRLLRSFSGGHPRYQAYLEDYSLAASAMVDLFEASGEISYLEFAKDLVSVMLDRFVDRERGGFYFTADDHEKLIVRSKPAFDGSTPSGNSAATMALLRLHAFTGDDRLLEEASRTVRLFATAATSQPFGYAHLLEAVDLYQRGAVQIVLVGGSAAQARDWMREIGRLYIPNRAVFIGSEREIDTSARLPEPVRDRAPIGGALTAYVCHGRVCSAPITSLEKLIAELQNS
jgi:uncharacterized protein YyaL (SSP411 family)